MIVFRTYLIVRFKIFCIFALRTNKSKEVMKTNYELRYASNPVDAKTYDTSRLRKDFLIETLFVADEVNMVYSMYDRMIVGGAMPVNEKLKLEHT